MLYQVVTFINILLFIMVILVIENQMLKYIQDSNYSFYCFKKYIKWYYIKNYYMNLYIIFGISMIFYNEIVGLIFLLNIYVLYKYCLRNDIIKIKYTRRIKTLFILNIIFILLILFVMVVLLSIGILITLSFITYSIIFINIIAFGVDCIIEMFINKKYKKRMKEKLNDLSPFCIGVTGSGGKTSVKNIIYEFIKHDYISFMSPYSYNTLKGIEKTINNIDNKYKNCHLILELGAKRIGDIEEIVKYISLDIAFILNIYPQHLETFKTIDNIKYEKFKIIDSLKSNGYLVLNNDDEILGNSRNEIRKDINIITFGIDNESDVMALDIKYSLDYTCFNIKYNNNIYFIKTKLLSKSAVYNILASFCALIILNCNIHNCLDRLINYNGVNNRLIKEEKENLIVLNDAYNSNIKGFINAIDILNLSNDYKIIITPGIVETNNDTNEIIARIINDKKIFTILINNYNVTSYLKVFQNNDYYNYIVMDSFINAYNYVLELSKEKKICLLIENDLTDNYFI